MKIVYIAHPIGGAVKANVARVERIVEHVMEKRSTYWPIAPYLDACKYLCDDVPEDRARAFKANKRYFDAGIVQELWVCGRVSTGVQTEINWAIERGISVVFKDFSKELGT